MDTKFFRLGQTTARLNGRELKMPAPVLLVRDRTFLPLRFAATAFGGVVQWDSRTSTVHIDLKAQIEWLHIEPFSWRGQHLVLP